MNIAEWDEHKIGIDRLTKRYGFRSDYFLKVGMTLEYVEYHHKNFSKNEITNYMQDIGKLFAKVFGSCVSQDQCQMMNSQTPQGEVNLNSRLSYIPVPVAHVLRDGKKYLVDAKEIIEGDIVQIDSKVSGVVPADIVLYEASDELEIGAYLDTYDLAGKHFDRNDPFPIPDSATKKQVTTDDGESITDFILDSPNFVPMGARIIDGHGKGICIRTANRTVKALLR